MNPLEFHWMRDIPAPQMRRWFRVYFDRTPKPKYSWEFRTYVWVVKVFMYKRTIWLSWWDKEAVVAGKTKLKVRMVEAGPDDDDWDDDF